MTAGRVAEPGVCQPGSEAVSGRVGALPVLYPFISWPFVKYHTVYIISR